MVLQEISPKWNEIQISIPTRDNKVTKSWNEFKKSVMELLVFWPNQEPSLWSELCSPMINEVILDHMAFIWVG